MSNILLKLIKFGIGFILFIPLYVGGSFFFPFIFPKIWLFGLITEIIFFLYIILAISDSRYRTKMNLVFWALALLTIILVITSFSGIDVFRSFWGNTERMSGVIYWIHFVAFAFILSGVIKTEKEWKNFFGLAVLVSVMEFFYVLAQYLGSSLTWLPGSQMGTIGNTDLLAIYAIFSAFFSLYLWHDNANKAIRGLWAAAFFLNIGTLYLASSRGAILGFGAGIFFYILTQVWQKPQARKVFAIAILIPVVLYGIIWLLRGANFVKNTSQLTRIVNFSLKDDTVQQRFTEWGIAWSAFKSRPIFGWGPNNYLYLHNAYLNPKVYNLRETNFDRAHNAYLDYASMSGILGLVGYLFLIAVLFWVFAKNKLLTFASLVVAYAVSSFFVFDSPASYISLFLTIGFAIFVKNSKLEILNTKQFKNSTNSQIIIAVSIFYFLFSVFLIWQVSVKPAFANLNFAKAFSGINTGVLTPDEAFESYRKSLKYETLGTTEFRNQFIQWVQTAISKFSPEKRLEVVNFGISELEKEVVYHPLVFSDMNLGFLYYFKASGLSDAAERAKFFRESARAYEDGLKLAPKRLEIYYSYLQLAIAAKDYNRGLEVIKKTTEIAPKYGKNWWYQGIAYVTNGQDDNAISSLNRALELWYSRFINIAEKNGRLEYDVSDASKINFAFAPKQEILGIVNVYIKKGYFKELLLLYLGAAAEDQNDVKIHQSLALVYKNLGFDDKAIEELKIVDRLSPK